MFTYKPCNAAPHPEKQALRHMEMIRHDQLWPSCHLQEIRYDFVSNLFSSYIMRKKKRDRIGPVIRTSVSLPDKSVTCCTLRPKLIRSDTCSGVSLRLQSMWLSKTALTMNVSLKDAKTWATPKTCSPSRTVGPRVTVSSLGSLVFLFDWHDKSHHS